MKNKKPGRPTETKLAEIQVRALMSYFAESSPDFINNALIEAIDQAAERLNLPSPNYDEPEDEQYEMLVNIFARAQNLDLRDDDQKVLTALHELLHNPATPQDLYENCAQFQTEQSNECGEDHYHSIANLSLVLATVKREDKREAFVKARLAEEEGAESLHGEH